jgi:hypothetical protein
VAAKHESGCCEKERSAECGGGRRGRKSAAVSRRRPLAVASGKAAIVKHFCWKGVAVARRYLRADNRSDESISVF